MPVTPEYSWTETRSHVVLTVTIRTIAVNKQKPDLLVTSCFFKLNSPPSLLQLDLYGAVDYQDSSIKAVLAGSSIRVRLPKVTPGLWGQLRTTTGTYEEITARRDASVKEYEEYQQGVVKQKRLQVTKESKTALQAEWQLTDKQRSTIRQLKQQDIADTKQALEEWEDVVADPASSALATTAAAAAAAVRTKKPMKEKPFEAPNLPPVRQRHKKIEIQFSERTFKGPAREENDIMMTKLLEKKRRHGKEDAVGLEEQQPVFLLDKGQGFLAARNYDAAISAFTEAIMLIRQEHPEDSSMDEPTKLLRAKCFGYRAETYSAMAAKALPVTTMTSSSSSTSSAKRVPLYADVMKYTPRLMCCAGDAADALALFSTVQGDANLLQVQPRMLLLNTLRAQSLRALGELETALPHYDVCLTLAASLQDTAAEKTAAESKTKVFDMLQLQQQGAANQFKTQGDAAFKEKKVALAISHYTSALLLDPKLIAAYSNRAMCYSILGQNAAAIVGYHFAIFLLQADDEESVKKTAKFLARRGAVYWAHSMHDQARTDLKNALDLLDEQSALRPKLEADLAVLVLSIRFRNVTKKAQRAFKQDDMDDAIRLYTKGLQLYSDKISKQKGQQIDVTVMASLLSNRAACQLQAGLYALCAKDCLRSLNLLEHAPAETAEVKDRVSSIKIATSIRLGTAQAEVGKLDEAIELYETSLAQAPSSHFSEEERAAILADLKMLKAQNN